MGYLSVILLTGIGATAVMDLWGLARKALLGLAPPNYALVGRWFGHMAHGRFRHDSIAAAASVPGEHAIRVGSSLFDRYRIRSRAHRNMRAQLGSAPNHCTFPCFRYCDRRSPLPVNAARYGRRHRRLANAASRLCSAAEPYHTRGFWYRPLCSSSSTAVLAIDMRPGPSRNRMC